MLVEILLVIHIALLGFWLGAELAINTTYRYVSRGRDMPFLERDRLMDRVLNMDQYVRFALIGQAGVGAFLAVRLGYLPGGSWAASLALALAAAWLLLVEITHRRRNEPGGKQLARIDRVVRYAMIALLILVAATGVTDQSALPGWLAFKLVLFAVIIGCGLSLRFQLMAFYRNWKIMEQIGSTDDSEAEIMRIDRRATSILVILWACIAGIVALSILKPA